MTKPRRLMAPKTGARLKVAPAVPEKGTYNRKREPVRDYDAFRTRGGRR